LSRGQRDWPSIICQGIVAGLSDGLAPDQQLVGIAARIEQVERLGRGLGHWQRIISKSAAVLGFSIANIGNSAVPMAG